MGIDDMKGSIQMNVTHKLRVGVGWNWAEEGV
jgi:hypothetical protein